MPGAAALSTASAKHSFRASSSVGSEKDKLRTSTTGFVEQKIGLAKDRSFTCSQQGKTFGRNVCVRSWQCFVSGMVWATSVWLPTHLTVVASEQCDIRALPITCHDTLTINSILLLAMTTWGGFGEITCVWFCELSEASFTWNVFLQAIARQKPDLNLLYLFHSDV